MKMKSFLKFILLLSSLLCSLACSNVNKPQNEIKKIISNCESCPKNFKFVMLIPSLGCVGCISDAEEFLKENINNSDYLFVLEEVQSKKMLKIRLGFDFERSERVIYINNKINFLEEFTSPLIFDTSTGSISPWEKLQVFQN
ncbi:hypothetical protein Aconfl_08240 [Algoriphagus confluentis]|uniref:Uncharacterized protein n=1 Tax=Algoriphagus confluentis TaxID=1697556 RepID=A0ABQ6PJU5_9BACT|nr:hypothetical protein Aconfl_08240 [Algoriphagus confluentis]